MDDLLYPVGSGTNAPAKVSNCIVGADRSRMAYTLHGITTYGTNGGGCVTQTHVHRIRSMTKVVNSGVNSVLMSAKVVVWRSGKAQPRCRHSLTRSLKGDHR